MITCAFWILLGTRCVLSTPAAEAPPEATPPDAEAQAQIDAQIKAEIEAQIEARIEARIKALMELHLSELAHPSVIVQRRDAAAPGARSTRQPLHGTSYPMRIYACTASGPVREFIAVPQCTVIPADPGR